MLLKSQSLNIGEDNPNSVVDVVFIQDSSRFSCNNIYDGRILQVPPLILSSTTSFEARIMTFQHQSELNSSRYASLAAKRMWLDLREARKNAIENRPVVFVIDTMTGLSVIKIFLKALADEQTNLYVATPIGLTYIAASRALDLHVTRQTTVSTASQPCQFKLQSGVEGLSIYFTLPANSQGDNVSEHEIISLGGQTNFEILLRSAFNYTPRFAAGHNEKEFFDIADHARDYILGKILNGVGHITRVMNLGMTNKKQALSSTCYNNSYVDAVTNRLSQSFQTLYPVSNNSLAYVENHASGNWLIERHEFVYWLRNDNCSTFWLSGSRGAGKSTLASYVLECLQGGLLDNAESSTIVHYFNNAQYRASASAAMVLKEMIRGLLPRQNRNSMRARLLSILAVLECEDHKMSVPQLRSYFAVIQGAVAVGERLFLVLDGLDEVEEPESSLVEELLYLAQRRNVTSRIKCFVSGNPSWPREDIFNSGERINVDEEVRSRPDLAYFVKSEVGKFLHGSRFAQAVYERLSASHDGVFSRAVLVVRSLREFDHSSQVRISSFIDSIPQTLASAYQEMLSSVAERDRKNSFKLLAFVTYTFRPLRISELLDAMEFDMRQVYPTSCDFNDYIHTEDDIKRLSGGLLTFGKDHTVQFIHNSVRDFVIAQGSILVPSSFCMGEYQAHEMLSRICLSYLRPCYIKRGMDSPKDTEVLDSFGGGKYHHFIQYATQYWSYHYKAAEPKSDHLPGLLQHLIQENLEYSWHSNCRCTGATVRPSTQDSDRAALCIATKVGSVKLMKMLLEMGADPSTYIDSAENSALHVAAAYGHFPVANLLLTRGARVDLPTGVSKKTPLYYASAAGHSDVMSLLLSTESISTKKSVSLRGGCVPFCTTWVLCDEPGEQRFRIQQKDRAKHEGFLADSDSINAAAAFSTAKLKRGRTWVMPIRCAMADGEDIRENLLGDQHQHHCEVMHEDSKRTTVELERYVLEQLVRQLLQTGIDGVWKYSKDHGLQRPKVNCAMRTQSRIAIQWHLIVDGEDEKRIAQNWGEALEIAVQRGQEKSIRLLLQDKAVISPKISSAFCARFDDIDESGQNFELCWHSWPPSRKDSDSYWGPKRIENAKLSR